KMASPRSKSIPSNRCALPPRTVDAGGAMRPIVPRIHGAAARLFRRIAQIVTPQRRPSHRGAAPTPDSGDA
ncbi:MAG TPA: hypothetical protein VGR36_06210, partial [Candidatus Acidoferrales bacterium]|nr:hypothetical protein [Candidatus Acidoferrales bacterium]